MLQLFATFFFVNTFITFWLRPSSHSLHPSSCNPFSHCNLTHSLTTYTILHCSPLCFNTSNTRHCILYHHNTPCGSSFHPCFVQPLTNLCRSLSAPFVFRAHVYPLWLMQHLFKHLSNTGDFLFWIKYHVASFQTLIKHARLPSLWAKLSLSSSIIVHTSNTCGCLCYRPSLSSLLQHLVAPLHPTRASVFLCARLICSNSYIVQWFSSNTCAAFFLLTNQAYLVQFSFMRHLSIPHAWFYYKSGVSCLVQHHAASLHSTRAACRPR